MTFNNKQNARVTQKSPDKNHLVFNTNCKAERHLPQGIRLPPFVS
jgi:hypothetical protein